MTNTKHTPGPWRLSGVWAGDDDTIYSGVMALARVITEREHVKTPIREWEANARLIAAAPAMLEALEALMESATDGRKIPEWLEERLVNAKAAIRLAVGETDQEQARVIGNGMHRSRQGELG